MVIKKGSIYHSIKRDRWVYEYYVKSLNGKRIRKNISAKTKTALKDKLSGLDLEHVGITQFGEWLDEWLEKYTKDNVAPKTYCFYKNLMKYVPDHLRKKLLSELDSADITNLIRDARDRKGKKLSVTTARSLRSFYKSAKKAKKDPVVMLKNGYLTKEMQKQEERWDKVRDAYEDGQQEVSYRDLMLNYLECIKQTGCVDWYEWRNKNWYTKWNACKSTINGNLVTFYTVNCAPRPIFIEMAKKYPDVTFVVCVKTLEPPVKFFFIEYKYNRKKKKVKETVVNEWQEDELDWADN